MRHAYILNSVFFLKKALSSSNYKMKMAMSAHKMSSLAKVSKPYVDKESNKYKPGPKRWDVSDGPTRDTALSFEVTSTLAHTSGL